MSRLVYIGVGIAVGAGLLLGACQSGTSDDSDGPESTQPTDTSPGSSSSSPPGPGTSVFPAGDIDHGLDPYIRRARDDLAARLAIDPGQIETVSAVLVVWPDAALGCPDPGKSYATVLTDGAVIELSAGDRVYRYHSGGSTRPFLCERPLRTTPTRL
jgi:hypothetical protein